MGLTKKHDQLNVELVQHNDIKAEVKIRPDPTEAGKLIGAAGKTVKSLQTVMRATALQYGVTLFLTVEADQRPATAHRDRPVRDPHWQPDSLINIIRATCMMALTYAPQIRTKKENGRDGDYWTIDIILHPDESPRVSGRPVDGMSLVCAMKHIFSCIACGQGGKVSVEFMRE